MPRSAASCGIETGGPGSGSGPTSGRTTLHLPPPPGWKPHERKRGREIVLGAPPPRRARGVSRPFVMSSPRVRTGVRGDARNFAFRRSASVDSHPRSPVDGAPQWQHRSSRTRIEWAMVVTDGEHGPSRLIKSNGVVPNVRGSLTVSPASVHPKSEAGCEAQQLGGKWIVLRADVRPCLLPPSPRAIITIALLDLPPRPGAGLRASRT